MTGKIANRAALVGIVLLSLASACNSSPRGNANASQPESKTTVRPINCAGHLRYRIDRPSFASSPGGKFSAARLDDLARRAAPAFAAAANEMCAKGSLAPDVLRRVTTIVIQTGSGATESAVYDDPETGPETLFFQYIFAESGLALPDKADIQAGLRCWHEPEREECEGRGD
jgi:hypothetical protein